MSTRTFKTAVIGCGIIARKFAEAANQMDGVDIIGVTDAYPGAANKYADEYRVDRIYDTVEEILALDDIDLVYIATPNNTHFKLTKQALLAGKHVLCENR